MSNFNTSVPAGENKNVTVAHTVIVIWNCFFYTDPAAAEQNDRPKASAIMQSLKQTTKLAKKLYRAYCY